MKRLILGCLIALSLILLTDTAASAQRVSDLPVRGIDTGTYFAGIRNSGGVFTTYRFRAPMPVDSGIYGTRYYISNGFVPLSRTLTTGWNGATYVFSGNMTLTSPNLANVLSQGNTATTGFVITTGTNELHASTSYAGFKVQYGTTVMAGIRSAYGTYGYLDLCTATKTATLSPELISSNRNYKLPDKDGTIALTNQWGGGTATLSSGTVTVTDGSCTVSSVITVTRKTASGTISAGGYTAVAGSGSFVITGYTAVGGTQTLDNSVVQYTIKYY